MMSSKLDSIVERVSLSDWMLVSLHLLLIGLDILYQDYL